MTDFGDRPAHVIDVGERVKIHGDAWCVVDRIDADAEPGFLHIHVRPKWDGDPTACYLPAQGWYRLAPWETVLTGRRHPE
jgi:hypothetical protein